MILVSYDITDDKLRTKFSKFLMKSGGIRLQYSLYEFNNSTRMLNNVRESITNEFSKKFTPDDSVVIFTASNGNVEKFGNAIHRDKDLLVF